MSLRWVWKTHTNGYIMPPFTVKLKPQYAYHKIKQWQQIMLEIQFTNNNLTQYAVCVANWTKILCILQVGVKCSKTKYIEQHDKICTCFHWCNLQDCGASVPQTWHQHKPDPLGIFPDGQTIMYIMNQTMACPISSNYSKLVFFDKTCKTVLLIDVKFPMDNNMVKAAAEKYKKYWQLEILMKNKYKLCKIHTGPISIGALGTLCQHFDTNLVKASARCSFDTI